MYDCTTLWQIRVPTFTGPTYIDDVLCITTGNFDDHLEKLEKVLQHLKDSDLKMNAKKSSFVKDNVEYLGFEH